MQLIWKGDMTEIRDIREFQLILENTYTWAMRVFKLQISGFIDQWRTPLQHRFYSTEQSTAKLPVKRKGRLTARYSIW